MDSKSAATRRRRTRRVAAAFEDVIPHLNDPNYDLRPPSTPTPPPPYSRGSPPLTPVQDGVAPEVISSEGEGARRDIEQPLDRQVDAQSLPLNEHDECALLNFCHDYSTNFCLVKAKALEETSNSHRIGNWTLIVCH
jgi:hypothetical protein